MRWPWSKLEKRDSGGDFSDAVVRLIEAQAAGSAADASSTAAVEAASGALSRAFASARVEGPDHVQEAVTGSVLAQVGRDLIRSGDSMHVIDVDHVGHVSLLPCSSWHFEGDAHPRTWTVRASFYGPSSSTTRNVPFAGVVFVKWGSTPGQPYIGTSPISWAHTTARLQSEVERSLADEMAGPLAQLLAVPSDGGDGADDDPLRMLKADIRTARGKALLVETVAAGYGDGRSAAPQKDWVANRLGPHATRGPWQRSARIPSRRSWPRRGHRRVCSWVRPLGPHKERRCGGITWEPSSPWQNFLRTNWARSWRVTCGSCSTTMPSISLAEPRRSRSSLPVASA